MIYEPPVGPESRSLDEVARAAVKEGCDKFRFQNGIFKIDFSYRKVETVEMTDEEARRQFGDK